MRRAVAGMAMLLLAGCGAPTDGRYVGQLVGDPPAPCPDSRAVLLLRGTEARFVPDEGIIVLDGTVAPDGTIATAAERGSSRGGGGRSAAPPVPFRLVFNGRIEGGKVMGVYGTPRCRGHVELAPG